MITLISLKSTMSQQVHVHEPFVWHLSSVRCQPVYWKRNRYCSYCGIPLLNTENNGWCCLQGKHISKPLPPLPFEIQLLLDNPKLSSLSCVFNLIFSFATLETEGVFPSMDHHGPMGFFTASGRIYHCVRPSIHNSGTHWLLYNGYEPSRAPHERWANTLPSDWVSYVSSALKHVNPFVHALMKLHNLAQIHPEASVILSDQGKLSSLINLFFFGIMFLLLSYKYFM